MNLQEPAMYLINRTGYSGIYPPFHDASAYAWVKDVEAHWTEIRDELLSNEEFVSLNAPHVSGETGWKAIYLMNFTWTKHKNCQKFPVTMKVIGKVPNLTFAAFSMLGPDSQLMPHYGDTNTVLRCHLGIEVPEPVPVCALQVGDEIRGWQNGKITMFSECHLHTAWNKSDKRRIILSFDSMRDEFAPQKNMICARVLAAETLFFLSTNFPLFGGISKFLYKPLYWWAALAWYFYLPIQRRLTFLP